MNISASVAVGAHIFSALIYGGVGVFAALTLKEVVKAADPTVKAIIGTIMFLIIGLSSAFITSLVMWLHETGIEGAGSLTSMLWMMYNWVNAATIATFIAASKVFLQWNPVPCYDAPAECPRRVERRFKATKVKHERRRAIVAPPTVLNQEI